MALAFAEASLAGATSEAAEPSESPPIRDAAPPAESLPEKRPVPDYDGRGPEPSTLERDLLWIPRIALAPLYLVSEFLVRRPIGAILSALEHDKTTQKVLSLFASEDHGEKPYGLAPVIGWDVGLEPSVGVYFWWDHAKGHHVRAHFGTWGLDRLHASVLDRYDVGAESTAGFRAAFSRRNDNLFFGLGPDSRTSAKGRYLANVFDAGPVYDLRLFTHALRASTAAGVKLTSFEEGTCCGSYRVRDRVDDGEVREPPRLSDGGYTTVYDRLELALDTRGNNETATLTRHTPSRTTSTPSESLSGVRLALEGQPSFDVSRRPGASWLNYGLTASGSLDLTHTFRVVTLSVSTLFSDPLQGGPSAIPFTELVTLGGNGWMRGFLPGRLIDRSAAVATLAYQWPVWAFLDGEIEISAGNVFGEGLRGFDAGKLRLSSAIGLRTTTTHDNAFELLTGFGTETFDMGTRITSVRIALGATRGL